MARTVRSTLILVGIGAAGALVLGAAAASQSDGRADAPAQLDRTFGSDATGGAGDAGTSRTATETRDAGTDGGRPRSGVGLDGGWGSRSEGTATGNGDAGIGGSGGDAGQDHTNIILYGPNGIPPDKPSS